MNGTEEKEKQQCNIVANYAIVTILMGALPATETTKVLLKSVIIFIYYPQTENCKIQHNIQHNIKDVLHAGESIKLKQKCQDSDGPSALQYSSETLAPNI